MTPSPRKSGKTTSAAGRDGITCAPRPRCLRRSCSSSRSEAGRRMEQNEFCDGCATAAELACDSVLRARVAVCSDSVLRDVTAAEVDQRERVVVDRSDSALLALIVVIPVKKNWTTWSQVFTWVLVPNLIVFAWLVLTMPD